MLQDQALAGLRVAEFGSAIAVPYCGKLLADLGAEVVKVEPPGGEVGRRYEPTLQLADGRRESALFLYLNQGKKGITLDLSREDDRRSMVELVRWADLFIADLPHSERSLWYLDPGSVAALNPRLVYLSITPFGDSGPLADWLGSDLIAAHAGGLAWITPMQPDGTDSSPLRPGGDQADFLAALLGAYAALIARHHQLQTGQGQIIDLSRQESVISILDNVVPTLSYEGGILRRGRVMPTAPCHVMECKDGYVFAQTTEEPEWARFLELAGNPEWGQDERFRDRFARAKHWNELVPLVEPWLKSRAKAEIYLKAQERRVAFNPVNSAPDLLSYEHFEARDFFVSLPDCPEVKVPGAPFKLSKTPWRQGGRAPSLDEHNDSVLGQLIKQPESLRLVPSRRPEGRVEAVSREGSASAGSSDPLPLSGMRVTDFSWHWAGPFCSKMLGHMGAEVIKIESQAKMEHSRHARPFADGLPGLNRSGLFNSRNQSRLGIRLNLKSQEGKALAKRLVAISDVVLENFAAGVMARLGLDYEVLSAINSRLVMCSASAYGATGPHHNFISYGATQCAFTGLAQITGYEGGPPNMVGVHLADPVGGLYAGIAILAALEYRDRTGKGQYIDLSQAETMSALMVESLLEYQVTGAIPTRHGNHDPRFAPHNCYRCEGDDSWVAIAVQTDDQWKALCEVASWEDWARDDRFASAGRRKEREGEIDRRLEEWTRQRSPMAAAESLQRAGVPAAPSFDGKTLVELPHLVSRNCFVVEDHPEVGARLDYGIPWRMSRTPGRTTRAPLFGEHESYVFGELLGLSEREIADLRERMVIY